MLAWLAQTGFPFRKGGMLPAASLGLGAFFFCSPQGILETRSRLLDRLICCLQSVQSQQSSSVWSLAALSMFVLLLQVEGKSSIILTFKQLIAEEGPWGLTKGLSARIISATPSTIVIVVGYETLKKLSLRPELVDSRHW